MSELSQQIQTIGNKVTRVLGHIEQLQLEKQKAEQKAIEAEQKLQNALQQLDALQVQNVLLKSSMQELNEEDKRVMMKRLNQYIKHVDDCIAYLSK